MTCRSSGTRDGAAPGGSLTARAAGLALGAALLACAACGNSNWQATDPTDQGSGGSGGGPDVLPDYPKGFHVVGNHIEDANGARVELHGVNRSGTEYQCATTGGFFDGPNDDASVRAMTTWNVNAVRVPLNEDCWLAINGVSAAFSGDAYKSVIQSYVHLLHKYSLIPILELHWAAPGNYIANRQHPMPNADHTPAFWADVASTFQDDEGVVFEPFNEPYPDGNRDSDAGWQCWRDGCTVNLSGIPRDQPQVPYQAAGFQSLVTAIRNTGSRHLVLLGGLQFSNALTQWLAYKPTDPLDNLAAAWHIYNNNPCASSDCWDGAPAAVAAQYPLVATEIGQNDCLGDFITPLMQWLDGKSSSYLAWSWNVNGACAAASNQSAGQPFSLIVDYGTAAPNGMYAQTFHDHVMSLTP